VTPPTVKPIRVLLWIPSGMQRSIILAQLMGQADIEIVATDPPRRGEDEPSVLHETVRMTMPDVVVTLVPAADANRLTRDLRGVKVILMSNDGRSAISCQADVSSGTLRRMIRAAVQSELDPGGDR
jgi:hypothetical protein